MAREKKNEQVKVNFNSNNAFLKDKLSELDEFLEENDKRIDEFLAQKGVDMDKLHDPDRPTFVGK